MLNIPRIFLQRVKLPGRKFAQETSPKKKENSYRWHKLAFELSGYNRYGLYTDDIVNHEEKHIKEALRRLPKDVLDARNFRSIRAMQLDMLKIYLPKEQWVTFEEDLENRYLRPYVEEIIAEQKEIYEFGCQNYHESDWPADEVK